MNKLNRLIFLLLLFAIQQHFVVAQELNETVYYQDTRYPFGKLNPNAPPETAQWGQLAGMWTCISKDVATRNPEDTVWYTNHALWKWEYVLGGHAVLNEWWQKDVSPIAPTKEFFATGIFIFNPKTKKWEAVVLNSRPHKISPHFQAEFKDGKIKMHDGTGKWLVTFYDIKPNSFEWRYDIATEDGGWRPISFISARRYQ